MPTSAATRPRRTYRTRWPVHVLRGVPFALWLAVTIVALRRYPELPDTIAIHFTATGEPDGYGSRVSVLVLLALWWLLLGALFWLSRWPRLLNYPVAITAGNAQRLYRQAEEMLVVLMLALALLGTGLIALLLESEGGGGGTAGTLLLGCGVALTLVAVVGSLVRMFRADGRTEVDED